MQWTTIWAVAATASAVLLAALAIWQTIGARWDRKMRLVQSRILADCIQQRDELRQRETLRMQILADASAPPEAQEGGPQ